MPSGFGDILIFMMIGIPCIICFILGIIIGSAFTAGVMKERRKNNDQI